MSTIVLGHLKAGIGESGQIKVDDELVCNQSAVFNSTVVDSSTNPWGIESGSDVNGSYTKFPDGTLICWGETGVIGSGLSVVVTFPTPFISKPSLSLSSLTRTGYNLSAGENGNDTYLTATGVTIFCETGQDNKASWIAIGRWK